MMNTVEGNSDSYEAVEYGWDGEDFVTVDREGVTRRYKDAKVTNVQHADAEGVTSTSPFEFSFHIPKP
jgi:hypothetical protein